MGFEKTAGVILGLAMAVTLSAATLVIDEQLPAGEYILTPVVAPPVDSDTDGVPDDVDDCPDEYGTEPDGCPLPPVDADGDGLPDDIDACPTEPAQTEDGCPLPPPDADDDGVPDDIDQCADTPSGDTVDSVGCTVTPPDPGELANTPIGQLAATLAPGDSDLLPGSPKIQGYREDGTSAPSTAEWTSSAYWYPKNATAWFLGLRISHRFISYRADADQWVEYPLGESVPNSPDRFPGTGHTYESIALDQKRGHFYYLRGQYLYRYLIDDDAWEKTDNPGLYGMVVEWNDNIDSLVVLGGSTLRAYKDGVVTMLSESPVDGYHSSMRYNRKRGDMLMIGGNHSLRTVALMLPDGTVEQRSDAPFDFHINVCDLTYDPVSGNYVVVTKNKELWEYSPDRDEWRQAAWNDGYPLHNYLQQVPIVIDDLGVIAWLLPGGMQIYHHKTVFDDAPPVTPTPDPDPPIVVDPDPDTDNLLLEQATTMQPGEWRNISDLTTWDQVSKSVDYVDPADGSYPVTGMGWTQDLIYHDGAIMMMLMRGSDREVVFLHMDATGNFTRTAQPYSGSRRPYNKLASDGEYFYWMTPARDFSIPGMLRTPLDNPGVFEPYSPNLLDIQIESMTSLTYVPEWGRFYAYTPGGKLWSWAHGESAWTLNDRLKDHLSGYAGLVIWNPVKKELIVAGGQTFGSNPELGHHLARITEPLGKLEILPDMLDPTGAPIPFRANASRMIVDPRDGSYLINYEKQIYRNENAGGQYSEYLDLTTVGSPFGKYENYNPFALLPGTDVIVFLSHIKGVVLYRLGA